MTDVTAWLAVKLIEFQWRADVWVRVRDHKRRMYREGWTPRRRFER